MSRTLKIASRILTGSMLKAVKAKAKALFREFTDLVMAKDFEGADRTFFEYLDWAEDNVQPNMELVNTSEGRYEQFHEEASDIMEEIISELEFLKKNPDGTQTNNIMGLIDDFVSFEVVKAQYEEQAP